MNKIDKSKINQQLMERIFELLKDKPLATQFVLMYRELIHFADDLIDGDKQVNPETLLEFQELNARVFSLHYYRTNPDLEAIEFVINNVYADCVQWERSEIEWKRRDAQVLRHIGIEMFLYIIGKECGREVLREISPQFREQCHLMHMNDKEEAI